MALSPRDKATSTVIGGVLWMGADYDRIDRQTHMTQVLTVATLQPRRY
jgi:hypothetical protein